jgi:hypothetical protein
VLTDAKILFVSPTAEPTPLSSPNLDIFLAFVIGGFLSIYDGWLEWFGK